KRVLPGPSVRPPAPAKLFGRESLLESLIEGVIRPDGRIHVLTGPGGIGKTAVARALSDVVKAPPIEQTAWWVSARDADELQQSMISILDAVFDVSRNSIAEMQQSGSNLADIFWARAESREGWLLV